MGNFYNVSITLHGLLMIFFLVMPGLFGGFGNYFIPIFQGSPEVVYPRVNNFSILILSFSYLFIILSLISEFGGGTGWTIYPPLSTSFMSLSPSSTAYIIFGLLMSGISSCVTSLNFWVTILNMRCYSLTLKTMVLFSWSPCTLSTFILVFWSPRSLYFDPSRIWRYKYDYFRRLFQDHIWQPINDFCYELYCFIGNGCLRSSHVYCGHGD